MPLANRFGHRADEFENTAPRRRMPATPQNPLSSARGVSRADQQLWADEGAIPRRVVFKRHSFDFESAIDIEKIEAMLAWNGR